MLKKNPKKQTKKTHVYTVTSIQMFIALLFIITKYWK